jgi:hypothetical protein
MYIDDRWLYCAKSVLKVDRAAAARAGDRRRATTSPLSGGYSAFLCEEAAPACEGGSTPSVDVRVLNPLIPRRSPIPCADWRALRRDGGWGPLASRLK